MFHLLVNATNQFLKDVYNQYGLNFEVVASTDLDDLKQYTNNFTYKAIYRNDETVRMLDELQRKFNNTKDYSLLLYNYEPPRRAEDRLNNINLKAYFNEGKTFDRELKDIDPGALEFLHSIKTNGTTANNTFVTRDVKLIKMKINYKLISPSQEFIDNFTMLYLTDLQRNIGIPVTVDFGGYIGQHKIEIEPVFADIDTWGLIDVARAGDLKQVGFSVDITAPVFSNFTDLVSGLRDINLTLGVVNITEK